MTKKSEFPAVNLESDWLQRLNLLEQVHNLAAICRNERIVYLNATGAEMLGLQEGDRGLGIEFASFFHPDFKSIADLGLDVFAEDDTVISIKFIRPDGVEVEAEVWVAHLDFPGETSYLVEAHDITNHMRAARALRSREQRLNGILNTVADGIVSLDDKGFIQSFNPAAEGIFGFTRDEAIGKNVRILMPLPLEGETFTDFGTEWAKVLAPGREVVGQRKSGDTFPMEMAVREMRHGGQISFTSIVRDITARKKAEERVYHLAHHDPLTGLPNRHLLGDRLEEAVKRARRNKNELALMFIDLDRFKAINDELGHDAGDVALKIIAERFIISTRSTDTVARVGGDEFVVILEEIHNTDEAEKVAEKIITQLREPMEIEGSQCTIGTSIGISIFPDHAEDLPGLLRCADHAMYAVKGQFGGNHYHIYRPGDD